MAFWSKFVTEKIAQYLLEKTPDTPCLIVDLDCIEKNYKRVCSALSFANIFYAVKSNPGVPILKRLKRLNAFFETASIYEIKKCLNLGISPQKISFGSTIKKQVHISEAHKYGVTLYAFDSFRELEKLAKGAPGSQVYCRILMSGKGADWPSTGKFGCSPKVAEKLLFNAASLGLKPVGVSFHVGSQQKDLNQWKIGIQIVSKIFERVSARGIKLSLLNLGGGFPCNYNSRGRQIEEHGTVIEEALKKYFGKKQPNVIAEPGRSISADAGIIETEVVLISKKFEGSKRRWIYLDVGKFGGLPEASGEAIKYKFRTNYDGEPTGPAVIAGPTCDDVDVLYNTAGYQLPYGIEIGDRIQILSAGAYSASYSSVGFNGFPPLQEIFI